MYLMNDMTIPGRLFSTLTPFPAMTRSSLVSPDDIRTRFSRAMSDMYRQEVPQYGTLLDLVADINADVLAGSPELRDSLARSASLERLNLERHGAIRLGTAAELATMRRVFAVMGMEPVGYYDLSVAGIPVHSTAFRPVGDAALAANPFRVFTSLLRLDLLEDQALAAQAREILQRRNIFTARALALTEQFERDGGLDSAQADEFVEQVRETFRWHSEATVTAETYQALHDAHRLIADVVCFAGPHINHLTPRTLDIDALQAAMPGRGIPAKEVVEGPPRRKHPILLRQTSFKALEEPVRFLGADTAGTHTARFGEVEQRGIALTRKGRQRYDALLARAREQAPGQRYEDRLTEVFTEFPDDLDTLRAEGLAFFRYALTDDGLRHADPSAADLDIDALLARGLVQANPITYEDFLPVSAAGIFRSNLGSAEQRNYSANEARAAFERDLGCAVHDEIALYEAAQAESLARVRALLGQAEDAALPA